MRALCCLLPFAWFLAAEVLLAQAPVPARDDRAARIIERYEAMLAANPVEGLPLDRVWKAYEERGATAELLESHRLATEAPKSDAAAWLIYGYLLKKASRFDEAAAAYQRAGTLDPASPLPPSAAGELAMQRSQPKAAAEAYALAVTRLPEHDRRTADFLMKLGAAWSAAGQGDKAAETWEKIVTLNPADFALHRRLAENYEKLHLTAQAITHEESIVAHASAQERTIAWRDLGHLHEVRGEFDAARDALENGLALAARDNWLHGDLLGRLIRLYQRADRTPELEARWRAAVQRDPRDPGLHDNLGALAVAQGDAAKQIAELECIVSLTPDDRESTVKLARLLVDAGQRERAAVLYDRWLKLQPDNLDLLLARADLDLQLDQPENAVRRIEARIAQNPADESVATPALRFFLAHHLDQAVEKRLRADIASHPASAEPSLALGKFFLSARRFGDARVVLDEMAKAGVDPKEQAVRWGQAGEGFKQENLSDDALRCWRRASELQPLAAGPLLAQAEIWRTRDEPGKAADLLEKAVKTHPPNPERLEVERKLFDALQAADASRSAPAQASSGGLSAGDKPVGSHPEDQSAKYLAALAAEAAQQPSVENELRLARWQAWMHQTEQAAASAAKAIGIDPGQIGAREQLVDLLQSQGKWSEAEVRLREIMALDASRTNACLRQIATLELNGGSTEEAMALLGQLQREAPGDRGALTDLALAQQHADRWYDAAATWEKAYALPGLTSAQRDEVRRPLVMACEHLEQFARAFDVLRDAVNERTDLAAKEEAFGPLDEFCRKHGFDTRLSEEYEAKLSEHPDDYFTLVTVAKLRSEAGHERESYPLLVRADDVSPEPVGALRRLVDVALDLGEVAEATEHQRRLIALPGQSNAENIGRLADLQEGGLDEDAAAQTWDHLVTRFPRDTSVLKKAADFFARNGQPDRERELLVRLLALDASEVAQVKRLAALHIRAGDVAAALTCFEQVLARTEAEEPGASLSLPPELTAARPAEAPALSMTASRRLFPGEAAAIPPASIAANDDRHTRLEIIRQVSQLLFPADGDPEKRVIEDTRQGWLNGWREAAASGARSEPLAAFFYADQRALTTDLIAGWLKSCPENERAVVEAAFLRAGLRFADHRRVAGWVWGETDPLRRYQRGQQLFEVLRQFFANGGQASPTMVAELFPASLTVREILWDAARDVFAASHRYEQATELGERVLSQMTGGRVAYAAQVAEWELYLGRADRAREVLRGAVEEGGGTTLDASVDPALTALRAYYLLLPSAERPAFVEGYLQRMRSRGERLHVALAAALLHGLAGDRGAAQRDLDALLAWRLTTPASDGSFVDARRWAYLLANGQQLQVWNLDWMAAYLWRAAWKQAGAFDRQNLESEGQLAEMRRRLLSVEVALADDPQRATELAEEFLQDLPSLGAVSVEAEQLVAESQRPTAQRLYGALCERAPSNPEPWRNLFSIEADTRQTDAIERTLTEWCDGTRPMPNGANRLDLCARLATVRESNGDAAGAIRFLEKTRLTAAGNVPLLRQLAQAYERANRWSDALRVWRVAAPLDRDGNSKLGLAFAEERAGQVDEAVRLLRSRVQAGVPAEQAEAATRLAQIFLSLGQVDQAQNFVQELLRDRKLDLLPALAAAFRASGHPADAENFLLSGVRRTQDNAIRFRLQKALLEQIAESGGNRPDFARLMQRLERFASGSTTLRGEYEQEIKVLARVASPNAALEQALVRRWDHGHGDRWAGEALVSYYLQRHQDGPLRDTVAEIQRKTDLSDASLETLVASLTDAHPDLALIFAERLVERAPQNESRALKKAALLWRCGQREAANSFLETREQTSVFSDTITGAIGSLYLSLGDQGMARRYLERAVERDPSAIHAPQLYLQLAQLNVEAGRLSEARNLLRVAYRQPACEDLGPLVRYLTAAARRGDSVLSMADFPLSFARRSALFMAVRDHFVQSGEPEKGDRVVTIHPEYLSAVPGSLAEIAQSIPSENLPELTSALETALDWDGSVKPSLKRALVAVYQRRAHTELSGPTDVGQAKEGLKRANALEPDDFSIAKSLVQLYRADGETALMANVLQRFLSPEALPDERQEAAKLLVEDR